MTDLSVIICTHNPREDYLRRVLAALQAQTLPKAQWELLLIDNASAVPLAGRWDLSWHPRARHIREDELGLTPARLRGIRESVGDLLVFVDDDNVLAANYLANSLAVASKWPQLGAFGGSITGEFESAPPGWIAPYLEGLVVCELDRDYWSNLGGWSRATPYGAGLCVRRIVAQDYANKVNSSPLRRMLDRRGVELGAGGDSDLAWCALDQGMGTGRFCQLQLTHLIPEARLRQEYILHLQAGFAASSEILRHLRGGNTRLSGLAWLEQLRFLFNYLRKSGLERKILLSSKRARTQARRLLKASLGRSGRPR